MLVRLTLVALFGCGIPTWAAAQAPSSIRGVVQDESGGVLPGAAITVVRPVTGLVRETVSAADGAFTITNLPLDQYTLTVTVDGFDAFTTTVALRSSVPQELIIVLRVATQAAVVEVRPDAPLVDPTLTGTRAQVSFVGIEQLPAPVGSRGIESALVSLPGFAQDMPYFCLRVPTGGGKTFLAASAVALVNTHLLATEHSVVLWLVPSDAIREQTLKALRQPGHPYHHALKQAGAVTVMDLDEAKSVTRATLDTSTVVIAPAAFAARSTSAVRPLSMAFMRPTPPAWTTVASTTCGSIASLTTKSPVAPAMCSAGRDPSRRVVTMDDDVFHPCRRCMPAVSTPKCARRCSTQSPIRSSPTPPTASVRSPIFAAAIAAVPAAPETASVISSSG